MRGNSNMTLHSAAWHKVVAAFVAVATLLAMVIISGVASGGAYAVDSGHDLKEYVHDVKVQKSTDGGSTWSDFAGGTLQENEKLRVTFAFEIPAGTLTDTEAGRTFVYESPVGITDTDATKDNPGYFSSIKAHYYFEDNKIYIVFDSSVVQENQTQPITNGTFTFNSDAAHVDDGDSGKYDFGGGKKLDIKVNTKGDLTVAKSHSTISDDGSVEWTVEVSSKAGTKPGENIAITDVPSLGTIDSSSITVNGGTCSHTMTAGNQGFTMSCPALEENGKYTIVYTSKVDVADGEVTSQNNSVTVKAKDKNDNELEKKAYDSVSWDKKPTITKSDGALQEDGSVQWTVTVDATKLGDLNGWTLKDIVTGGALEGNITVSPAVNGQTEFSQFPITFGENNASQVYTFTYTTKASDGVMPTESTNKADLTPPNGKDSISTGDKGVNPGPYNPLAKTAGTVTLSKDEKTTVVPWTVTIAPKYSAEALPAGWKYTDRLSDNQYLDSSQRSALETAIKVSFQKAGLNEPEVTFQENNGKTVGFTVQSSSPLNVGQTIEFSYNATGTITQTWNGEQQYSNSGSIGKFTVNPSITFSPSNLSWNLSKIDAKTGSASDSTHEYNDSSSMEQVGGKPVMHWQVEVNQVEHIADVSSYVDLTITERLPSGVSLSSMSFNMGGEVNLSVPSSDGTAVTTIAGWWNLGDKSFQVTVTRSGNVLTIVVPAGLLSTVAVYGGGNNASWYKAELLLDVRATIDDVFVLGKTATVFKNTAKLSDSTGKDWGEKSQSQKITRDDEWDIVKKSSSYDQNGQDSGKQNLVPYSIVVNPNAMDLDKNSDTLTLNDEFTYDYKESNPVEFNLNEVKVYRYDSASGTKGEELDSSDYTATPTSSASGDKRVNGLTITVPDSTALLIEYSYKVVGQQNATVQVSNNVTMKGKTSGVSGQSVKVTESHGDAQITKMSFYKADSKDPSNRLEGAFFDLYKWDGTDWVRLCEGLRTDSKGAITFSAAKDSGNKECEENPNEVCGISSATIRLNEAYKLVETQAPEGYITPSGDDAIHYFMLRDKTAESTFPLTKPDDFPTDAIHIGGFEGYVLNDKETAKLPSTGGMGDAWFIGGGVLTVLVASFGLAESLKNAKRSKVSQK